MLQMLDSCPEVQFYDMDIRRVEMPFEFDAQYACGQLSTTYPPIVSKGLLYAGTYQYSNHKAC